MKTGVYTITNLINNKIYVGSTMQAFNKRKNQHYHLLRKNKHPNRHLQSAYNLYGEKSIVFEILESVLPEYCLSQEQYWMNMLNSTSPNVGYNLNVNATGKFGFKYSDESRLKMTISQLKFHGKNKDEIDKYILFKKLPKKYQTKEEKSEQVSGVKNPFYGRKHTKESISKAVSNHDYTKHYKKVAKCRMDGCILEKYDSLKEAKIKNNIKSSGGIGEALKYPNKSHKGFKWIYL